MEKRSGASPDIYIRQWYDRFNSPVTDGDCGLMCAPFSPTGKPFCCDICQAVPAVYRQEWAYLEHHTDLWHVWRGDECLNDPEDPKQLRAETPETMLLLACRGPEHCQREYRAFSCRQFPFFPYVTVEGRFIGLAYEWAFESTCWVISHLDQVTRTYREEFTQFYDDLFARWPEELESYAVLSMQMREEFAARRRRISLLHRNGGYYLLSAPSERLRRVSVQSLRHFGPY